MSIEMMLVSFLLALVLSFSAVQNTDVDLILEDGEFCFINDSYFDRDECNIETLDHSEYGSCISTKINMIKSFSENTKTAVDVMMFNMGDYTVPTGIEIAGDMCTLLDEDGLVGATLLQAVGISSDNCPPVAGIYGEECFSPTDIPAFAAGRYRVHLEFMEDDARILCLNIYAYMQ